MKKTICLLLCSLFASSAFALFVDRDPTPDETATAAKLKAESAQLGEARLVCVEDIMAIGGGVTTVSIYEVQKGVFSAYINSVVGRVDAASKIENLQCRADATVGSDWSVQLKGFYCDQEKYDKNRQSKGLSVYLAKDQGADFQITRITTTAAPRRNDGIEIMMQPDRNYEKLGHHGFECKLNTK